MGNNKEIKMILKKLKNTPVNEEFLKVLRSRLSDYVRLNPAVRTDSGERLYYKRSGNLFLKLKTMPIPLIIALIVALSGGGTVAASQNSLPGDTLYPVKTLTEKVEVIAAFSQASKAEVRMSLAQKRIQEIEKILERAKGGKGDGKNVAALQLALDNFNGQIDNILKQTSDLKNKGDLSAAAEINTGVRAALGIYKKVIEKDKKEHKGDIENQLDKTISSIEDSNKKAEDEQDDINKQEEEHAATKESAEGKINAAENKIAETEKFIQNKEEKLGADAVKGAKEKLNEAKSDIAKAKEYLNSNEYKEAFEKAKDAMESAIEAKAEIEVGHNFERGKKEDNGDNNDIENASSTASSTVSRNNINDHEKDDKNDNEKNRKSGD